MRGRELGAQKSAGDTDAELRREAQQVKEFPGVHGGVVSPLLNRLLIPTNQQEHHSSVWWAQVSINLCNRLQVLSRALPATAFPLLPSLQVRLLATVT